MNKAILFTSGLLACLLVTPVGAQRPVDEFGAETTKEIISDRERQDTLEANLASWLALENHSVVEISKLAVTKSDNESVRELAAQLEDGHSAMLKDLQVFIPKADIDERNDTNTAAERREIARQNHRSMMLIAQKAAETKLALTKKMLSRYEGQDFDMGYLGQQMVAHVQLLGTLHAMKAHGSDEFQQIVAGHKEKVAQHFKHLQQLAQRLEDDRRRGQVGAEREERLRPRLDLQPKPKTQLDPKPDFTPEIE